MLDYVIKNDPIYTNGDLKIQFLNNYPNYGVIKVKHYGWKCPSLYEEDYPVEDGIGYVKEGCKLIINFESVGSNNLYLSILFLSCDEIKILYDKCGRSGVILKKI